LLRTAVAGASAVALLRGTAIATAVASVVARLIAAIVAQVFSSVRSVAVTLIREVVRLLDGVALGLLAVHEVETYRTSVRDKTNETYEMCAPFVSASLSTSAAAKPASISFMSEWLGCCPEARR
jgi:hypothetical protein